ncbi:MAG: AAA family ATPase [Crenarchaeota archaeon]|nr:AAA family ATPase [Thermoproteota archaeon]MCR8455328.1 AAA family ATPase [Thermoproteota archaeon]MCR8501383.1 AAA family ATPase [Thermoproteota archaeon]
MGIIIRPESLEHTFVPDRLPAREELRYQLLSKIMDFFSKQSGAGFKGIYIYGGVGSGKTVLSRRVAMDLKAKFGDALDICYVNCRFSRRVYRVLAQIASQISPSLPRRGLSKDEFLELIFLATMERTKKLLVILDEIDSLFWGAEGDKATDFLYALSRYVERTPSGDLRVAALSISRSEEVIHKWLDPATRASFIHEKIFVKPYNPNELLEILKYRVELAFKPNSISDENIRYLANFVANQASGNARIAIDLLRLSGEIAEQQRASEIKPEHIRVAIEEYALLPTLDLEKLMGLELHKLLVLLSAVRALKNSDKAYVTKAIAQQHYREICAEYNEKPRKSTQIWRYLKEIHHELSGIVELEVSGKNQRGRSTRILINAPLEVFEKSIMKVLRMKLRQENL